MASSLPSYVSQPPHTLHVGFYAACPQCCTAVWQPVMTTDARFNEEETRFVREILGQREADTVLPPEVEHTVSHRATPISYNVVWAGPDLVDPNDRTLPASRYALIRDSKTHPLALHVFNPWTGPAPQDTIGTQVTLAYTDTPASQLPDAQRAKTHLKSSLMRPKSPPPHVRLMTQWHAKRQSSSAGPATAPNASTSGTQATVGGFGPIGLPSTAYELDATTGPVELSAVQLEAHELSGEDRFPRYELEAEVPPSASRDKTSPGPTEGMKAADGGPSSSKDDKPSSGTTGGARSFKRASTLRDRTIFDATDTRSHAEFSGRPRTDVDPEGHVEDGSQDEIAQGLAGFDLEVPHGRAESEGDPSSTVRKTSETSVSGSPETTTISKETRSRRQHERAG